MAKRSEFVELVLDQIAPLGAVTARAMFGGHGISCDGLFFALIAGDTLYLKADDRTRGRFEARGLGPFKPFDDKPVTMSYYPVPAELFDDRDELLDWARAAVGVALRARQHGPRRGRPTAGRGSPPGSRRGG